NADSLGTLFSQAFGVATGTRFDQVWGARVAELVVYDGSVDAANRQAALDSLTHTFVAQFASLIDDSTTMTGAEVSHPIQNQIEALVRRVDDQRSNAATQVAADGHTAAAATTPIGDLIATARLR